MSSGVISIKNQVESVLKANSDFRSNVECILKDAGVVILRGCVQSFFLKQRAQEMVRKLDCVVRIFNELEVE